MALHYPADLNVFALVRTRDPAYRSKDTGLVKACENKLPGFYASHESDVTLRAVLDLEQLMGREIAWVAADFDLEDFCDGTTDIPGYRTAPMLFNSRRRFCTVEQKILPIAKWLYSQSEDLTEPYYMQIGFRADEPLRVEGWNCKNDVVKIPLFQSLETRRTKWFKYNWRISAFPLYWDCVTSADVNSFWGSRSIEFPEISNCEFCPFHTDEELLIQYKKNPHRANWYIQREALLGHSFGKSPLIERLSNPADGRQSSGSCQCSG